MAKYIEREALTKELNSKGVVHQMDNENFHYKQGYLTGLLKAVIVAKTLPTADVVEVKHGEWIVNAWDGNDWAIMPYIKGQHTDPFCSCCKEPAMRGVRSGTYETSNYCPNCGAKMNKRSTDNAKGNDTH